MNKNFKIAGVSIIAIISLFLAFKKFFLRKPDRNTPKNNSLFISPANGKVIGVRHFDFTGIPEAYITEKKESSIAGAVRILTSDVDAKGTIVSIALNLGNVHYQRAMVDSVVLKKTYSPGNFNNALKYDQEEFFRHENEHNEILLSTGTVQYKIVQIAGFVAKVIEDYVTVGQKVLQGDIIGLIKFGSQVTIILPSNVTVTVKENDILVDGETVVGKI